MKDAPFDPVMSALSVGLESLRWREDMIVTNYHGERVWLGPCLNEEGKRVGITDCCFEEHPCDHHKACAEKLWAQ